MKEVTNSCQSILPTIASLETTCKVSSIHVIELVGLILTVVNAIKFFSTFRH